MVFQINWLFGRAMLFKVSRDAQTKRRFAPWRRIREWLSRYGPRSAQQYQSLADISTNHLTASESQKWQDGRPGTIDLIE